MNKTSSQARLDRMIEAVRSAGEWVTRRQIAEQLGRKVLNPDDVFMLNLLVEQGQIEAKTEDRPGRLIDHKFLYRVKK